MKYMYLQIIITKYKIILKLIKSGFDLKVIIEDSLGSWCLMPLSTIEDNHRIFFSKSTKTK